MTAVLISMFMFALIGAITPGPVNIIATGAGANFGVWRALPYVLGATLSYTLIVFLVGIGLLQLGLVLPLVTTVMQYPAAVFLFYMAYRIATAEPAAAAAAQRSSIPPGRDSKAIPGVLRLTSEFAKA